MSVDSEKKNKQRKVLYISAGILTLFLVTGFVLVATGTISRDFFDYSKIKESVLKKDGLKPFETEEDEDLPLVETEDGVFFEKRTESGLDDELENRAIILESFPMEIPLSGGTVISSSDSGLDASVEIEVNATAQETLDWYINTFSQPGWEVTNQTTEELSEGWFSSTFEYSSVQIDEITEGYKPFRGVVFVNKEPQQQSAIITVKYFLD